MQTEMILDWVLDSETCFLLGAGASKCAGKPTMPELTARVANAISQETLDTLSTLKGAYNRDPTVEDLINYLLRCREIASAKRTPDPGSWTVEQIDREIASVKNEIAAAVGSDWQPSRVHRAFFERLLGQTNRSICDIFTLNYDTVIEATLEEMRLRYIDGFWGAENATFDAGIFDERIATGPAIRLHKLHGSVNWYRDDSGAVRRRPLVADHRGDRLLIYPTEQKYVQTQYGVYESLIARFRERLRDNRPNSKLVVIGYSFADDHINWAIEDSLRKSDGSLTVYAFMGTESDLDGQRRRLQVVAERCNSRFNAWVGQEFFIGAGLEHEEWEAVKALDLWRFEKLVEFITGVQHEPSTLTHSQSS